MAVSKSQQKAVHKYVKANYDRMELTVPKGRKEIIKAHAAAQGESVNSFINRAIDQTMAQEATESPTARVLGGVASLLPSGDAERACAASDGRGEGINSAPADKLEGE